MAIRKIQYPSVSRVINAPVSYPVVPGGDFCNFDLVLKPKSIQLGSFNNLVVVPTPYPVVPGGDFPKFDLVQKPKSIQLGSFTNTVYLPAVAVAFQPYVFSTFNQPQPVKLVQQDFLDTPQSPVTPVVQTYLFSEFSQPKVTVKVFQENTFNDYEAIQNYFFPVFTDFETPRFKQTIQYQSVQFTIFPTTQVVS